MNSKQSSPQKISSEEDITKLLLADPWRIDVLREAEKINLPSWWIGAGFLRNLVWDAIEGIESSPTRDVDLVYFDKENIDPETDWAYDKKLQSIYPNAEWEVRNQARMHYINKFRPYTSAEDGIAHWVETATCVAVKLENGKFKYLFCHGTDDLFNLVARPISSFKEPDLISTFYERIEKKQWREKWPDLKIEIEG